MEGDKEGREESNPFCISEHANILVFGPTFFSMQAMEPV